MRGLVCLTLWLLPAVSTAQTARAREAERRSDRAKILYRDGNYPEALLLFQAAYDLDPAPRHLYNVALSREKTLDYEGCAAAFAGYLGATGGAADAQTVEHRARAEEGLARCRARATIPVRVSSSPPAAALFLEEAGTKVARGRTPRELQLAPGRYRLTAELSGYLPATQEVVVEVGHRPEVDFALEKLSTLRVAVDPAGAEIQIDDAPWVTAPAERQMPAGAHRVVVRKQGYEGMSRTLEIASGQDLSLLLRLTPLPVRRAVALSIRPGARLRIDGRELAANQARPALTPGFHRVEASAPGSLPFAGDVRIPDEEGRTLHIHLPRERTRTEKIVFWSLLAGAATAATVATFYGLQVMDDHAAFEERQSVALRDQGRRHALIADVSLATAGTLAVGALVYYFVITRPGEPSGEVK